MRELRALPIALFVALLFLLGCADTHEAEPMACVKAFSTVLEEWETLFNEPVPEHCQHLDEDYEVRLVPSDQFPWGSCDPLAVGCTVPGHMAIYILEGRSDRSTVNTSVHEWIHALSACAIGDPDVGHYRSGLWEDSRPTSVEVRAQAAAVLGSCL